MIGVTRIFKIGLRVAEWATPHVKEWHRVRHLNRNEAQHHFDARNWSEAEKYLQLALEEPQHSAVDRLEFLLRLAEAQGRQGKLEDAEETASRAIKLAVHEENGSLHALALDALADVQLNQQRYGEAEKSAQEVIHLETARAKPDHTLLASSSRKLASALEKNQRPAEALEALKMALSHAEKAFGAGHTETAHHLHELGLMHQRGGDHGAAQGCFRRALGIQRAVGMNSAADTQEATQTLYHLAASLEESGHLHDAAAEFEKMLALRDRQIGADREETARAQVRLAALHLRSGRIASARELLLQALPALEGTGGPPLALALEALASAEERSGRAQQARQYREKAVVAAALHAAK